MQSHPETKILKCIKDCYFNEGLTGFFKGMSLPLYTISILNAASLVGNEFAKCLVGIEKKDSEFSVRESFMCGFFAGCCTCPIATPVEIVKCKLQIQTESKSKVYYKGLFDCISKIYKDEKGIRGLYRGNISTFGRETFGYGFQFGFYQIIKLWLAKIKGIKYDDLSSFDIIIAGSVAGVAGWVPSYHFDIAKTLIQTEQKIEISLSHLHNKDKAESCYKKFYCSKRKTDIVQYKKTGFDGGLINCLRHIILSQGVKGLFSGFMPCAVGAFYSYGIMFLVYEHSKNYLIGKLN